MLDPKKIYQTSMDRLKVNNSCDQSRTIYVSQTDFGLCNLHNGHGSLITGARKSGGNMKKILKGAFQILHDTPAQRERYVSIAGLTKYLLFLCAAQ